MSAEFSSAKSMKIETKVPPKLSSITQIPPSVSIIWVLDESIELYLKDPVWRYFAPIIKPLSKRNTDRIYMASFIIGNWDFQIDKEDWE